MDGFPCGVTPGTTGAAGRGERGMGHADRRKYAEPAHRNVETRLLPGCASNDSFFPQFRSLWWPGEVDAGVPQAARAAWNDTGTAAR